MTNGSTTEEYFIEPITVGLMQDNKWGYARDDGIIPAEPIVWTGVTTSPAVVDNYASATDLTLGRDTRVWFGAKVDYDLPACDYSGTVMITVVGNGL
jgi:hypothetical protein